MSNKRIIDLPAASSGQAADLVFLYQDGVLKNCTLADLLASLAQVFPCASFAAADLPTPSENRGRIVHCTDPNGGDPALAISDGAVWRLFDYGDTVVAAPEAVSLGTPGPDGIPFTMPALRPGAGSMILQKTSDDGTGNPDMGGWFDLVPGLSGSGTGTDATGGGGGSPGGYQTSRFHYRAKNTNGGAVGPVSSAVTIELPVAPDAPSLTGGANSGDIDITTPGVPDRANGFSVLRTDGGGGFGDFLSNPAPSTTYTQSVGPDVPCQAYVVAANIYGTTDGVVGSGTSTS